MPLLLVLAWSGSNTVVRADYWVGGPWGGWEEATHWSGGIVPDNTGGWAIAEVTNGTALISTTVPNVSEAWAGNSGQAGHIILTNGGSLQVDNWLVVGRTGDGGNTPLSTLTVQNGIINKAGDGFIVGDGMYCVGRVVVAGNGQINVTGGWVGVGNSYETGQGTLVLRDGAQFSSPGFDVNVGDWGNGRGWCYLQDNATLTLSRFWLGKWDNAIGVLWQSGGSVVGSGPAANEWCLGGELDQSPNAFGFYNLAGGTMSNPFNFQIGRWGKGVYYQTGGTNTQNGWCVVGRQGLSYGVAQVAGGRFIHTSASTHLIVGEQGRGELTVSGGGIVDCNLSLAIGHNYGGWMGSGFVNLNGGMLRVPAIERWGDAPGGLGYLNLNGGRIQAKASSPAFLQNLTEVRVYEDGTVFDSAGSDITVNQPLLGVSGEGVLGIPVTDGGAGYMAPPIVSITGGGGGGALALAELDPGAGTVTNILMTCPGSGYTNVPSVALIGGGASTPATLGTPVLGSVTSGGLTKLGAGILELGAVNTYGGPTIISNGTLRTGTPDAIPGGSPVTVANGAVFDLNNFDQSIGSLAGRGNVMLGSATLTVGQDDATTLAGVISGTGGLIKNGVGTLALMGANSYTGPTVINGGKLTVTTATTGAGDYRLTNDTALGLTVAAAQGQLQANDVIQDGSSFITLNFDLGAFGNPTVAPLNVAGTLAANGFLVVNVAATSLSVGQFPLIQYGSRGGSGIFILLALPDGVEASLVDNTDNHSIDLNVTAVLVESPKWAGTIPGGVWDIGLTPNWVSLSSGIPMTFQNDDPVLFDDSAPGTTTVVLDTTVYPGGVTINNSSLSYTLTGSGGISGPRGLTKNGGGVFTLANTGNDFTGPTVINAGSLVADAANALSSASAITVSGGTLEIQNFDQASADVTLLSGSIAGSGGTLTGTAYDVQNGTVTARLGGAGSLTKSGVGTVTLSGANTYSGDTVVNGGTLAAGAADTFSPDSPIQVNGGTLDLQTHNQVVGQATLISGNIAGSGGILTASSFEVQSGEVSVDLSGSGSLVKTGGGTVILSGDNSYAGETLVNGGSLVLQGNNTYGGDTVINSGAAVVSRDANLGNGNLVFNPGGTLRVDGVAPFVSARQMAFGTAAFNGGTFDIVSNSVALFSGAMTGAGSDTYFYKEGQGLMVYSGTSSFDDATHFFVNRGTLVLSNANLSVNRWSGVGSVPGADATLAVVGDSVLNVIHDFNIGDVDPSRARFYLADSARVVCNAFDIGKPANCAGAAYQVGGSIVNASSWVADWRIGGQWGTGDVGAYGFYLLAGGSMTNVANNWHVGAFAQGVYYQSGGINEQGGWTAFGRFGGAPSSGHGVGYLTGGQFIHSLPAQHVIIGEQGHGEFTVAGTAWVDLAGALWVSHNYDGLPGSGIVNLNGGLLATPQVAVAAPGGSSLLNFNGGTLRAKASEANFLGGLDAAYVYTNGAIIDTESHDIGIAQALLAPDGLGIASLNLSSGGSDYLGPPIVTITGDGSGATAVAEIDYFTGTVTNLVITSPGRGYTTEPSVTLSGGGGTGAAATSTLGSNPSGGLTKLGTGSLTLSGANTFAGPVQVTEGTLVHDGLFFDTVTVEANGTLSLGAGIEDLSVGGALALSGTLLLDINRDAPITSDLIFGVPSVLFGGRLVVNNLGSEPQLGDAFQLIDAASYSGAFAHMDLPALAPGLAWDIPTLLSYGYLVVQEAAPQTISTYHYDPNTGIMELEFTGNPGYAYRIEATTNLVPPIEWELLSTEIADLSTGVFGFTDTNAPAYPRRFYRTVHP